MPGLCCDKAAVSTFWGKFDVSHETASSLAVVISKFFILIHTGRKFGLLLYCQIWFLSLLPNLVFSSATLSGFSSLRGANAKIGMFAYPQLYGAQAFTSVTFSLRTNIIDHELLSTAHACNLTISI